MHHISSECVHCVGFWWPKTIFWANFDIWELLYRPPFSDEGQIWCARAEPRYRLTRQISSRLVYFVALWRRKTQNFAFFWTSVLSPLGGSLRKLNTSAQPQTFPYPMASKPFLYNKAFTAKSGAQTLTFKSMTNRQRDRQKKNSTFLAAQATGEI